MTEQAHFEALLQPHLNRVSRSFAVCIAQLHEPLRSWTGLAYLVCRLLDTVEDAPWTDVQAQSRAFDQLNAFLGSPPTAQQARAWADGFPDALPPGEAALLADACAVIGALHALPATALCAVREVAHKMAQGMRHYAQAWADSGRLQLHDSRDVNRYCYFVAGVVGELLTRLFALTDERFVPDPSTWRDAQHFGLFLQKVNLLKDQRKDEAERRFLVPCRRTLLESLPEHAQGALRYVTALPIEAQAFRIFCAWSLALGAASLPYIQADHHEATAAAHTIKIGRAQAQALMDEVTHIACDNRALEGAVAAAMGLLPELLQQETRAAAAPTGGAQARQTWFLALDHRPLCAQDLSALGMAPPPA